MVQWLLGLSRMAGALIKMLIDSLVTANETTDGFGRTGIPATPVREPRRWVGDPVTSSWVWRISVSVAP